MINPQLLNQMMNDILRENNIDSSPDKASPEVARKMLYLHALMTGSLTAMEIGVDAHDIAKMVSSFAKFFTEIVKAGHEVAETNRKATLN
jgi:hypothetical protein